MSVGLEVFNSSGLLSFNSDHVYLRVYGVIYIPPTTTSISFIAMPKPLGEVGDLFLIDITEGEITQNHISYAVTEGGDIQVNAPFNVPINLVRGRTLQYGWAG